jgi:hypothetical protein
VKRTFLTVLAALAFAAPAQADTINVTSFEDSGNALCPSANQCTLRRAIERSKENGGTGPADTIVLQAGTYQLGLGQLVTDTTNTDVTILGAGADKTVIVADANQRALEVQGESSFALRDLTIQGGNALDDVGGNVSVSFGELRLDRVRLLGGRASRGGGLALRGSAAVVSQSSIDGNTADFEGGGIAALEGSQLNVLSSTVSGNTSAEGGGVSVTGQTTFVTMFVLSTVANNTATSASGGGIAVRELAAAPSSVGLIVAGNRDALGTHNCSGAMTDNGGNVESGSDCGFARADSRQMVDAGVASTLVMDGGTTPVLPITAASPARDLVGPCSSVDQRGVQRPVGAACDAGAYEFVPAVQPPPPDPTPPPTPPAPPVATPTPEPTPVANRTVVVDEVKGTVKVQLPGSRRFVDIDDSQGIPKGSVVDTRKGTVELTSVPKAGAPPEKAKFYDGLFKVTQSGGITTLALVEELACPKRGNAAAAAKKAKKRKLWGDGKGAFRTQGKYSAATVRGTKWLVEDTCTTTLTRVAQGTVSVRDFVRKRDVIVRRGKPYTARARP